MVVLNTGVKYVEEVDVEHIFHTPSETLKDHLVVQCSCVRLLSMFFFLLLMKEELIEEEDVFSNSNTCSGINQI